MIIPTSADALSTRVTLRENHMRMGNVARHLAIGIATGAAMLAVSPVHAADQTGSVQGVVSDASGQPVAGAFVKLKNDERRLTFMVISQEQGRFEAKDLPPGQYRVQGVGGGYQSAWFNNVSVGAKDEAAKVGLSLSEHQGPALAPAWPQRIPEAEVLKASKDPMDLPNGACK